MLQASDFWEGWVSAAVAARLGGEKGGLALTTFPSRRGSRRRKPPGVAAARARQEFWLSEPTPFSFLIAQARAWVPGARQATGRPRNPTESAGI